MEAHYFHNKAASELLKRCVIITESTVGTETHCYVDDMTDTTENSSIFGLSVALVSSLTSQFPLHSPQLLPYSPSLPLKGHPEIETPAWMINHDTRWIPNSPYTILLLKGTSLIRTNVLVLLVSVVANSTGLFHEEQPPSE